MPLMPPLKPSASEFITTRGTRLHIRRWASLDANAPTLFMLHGWMDVSASFQFVVDALSHDWQVIAPDARGFGLSGWPVAEGACGHYWFPDYLADLDAIADHYAPLEPLNLVGHSMGANIACLYAGARPKRVRRVVDLEGFGMRASVAGSAPGRIEEWLNELRAPPALNSYASLDAVADRLIRTNPRLSRSKALFLAQHWASSDESGRFQLLADPAHKMRGPTLYQLDEVMAVWARVEAKVLHVEAAGSPTLASIAGTEPLAGFKQRFAAFPDWREEIIDNAGHMVHHDQPERIAAVIESFCA